MAIKNSATSPNLAVLLTKIAITAIRSIGEIIQIGGAPTPPGFPRSNERTSPPARLKPGSRRILEGLRMNSMDQGALTIRGVIVTAIRRAFLLSKTVLSIALFLELNAITSKITKIICQSRIDINVIGEKAQTKVNNSAIQKVFRQDRFSSCSSPNSDLINQGPITTNIKVPTLPLLIALNVVGEKV